MPSATTVLHFRCLAHSEELSLHTSRMYVRFANRCIEVWSPCWSHLPWSSGGQGCTFARRAREDCRHILPFTILTVSLNDRVSVIPMAFAGLETYCAGRNPSRRDNALFMHGTHVAWHCRKCFVKDRLLICDRN